MEMACPLKKPLPPEGPGSVFVLRQALGGELRGDYTCGQQCGQYQCCMSIKDVWAPLVRRTPLDCVSLLSLRVSSVYRQSQQVVAGQIYAMENI